MKWHRRWIERAIEVSTWSKDPSTKVGCVLVDPRFNTSIAEGYNGIPRGVEDRIERMTERPDKYKWMEHAERNACFNAARQGRATDGAVAYMNFLPQPCEDCTRALIQCGIVAIVGPNVPFPGVGKGEHYDTDNITIVMLDESGVRRVVVED